MITILAINGSAKKNGNTAKLLKKVLDYAEKEGAKTELLHLIDKDIKHCRSYCAEGGTTCSDPCSIKDDMQSVIEQIKKADALLLDSPTYWYNMSGLMKDFIDRLTTCDMTTPSILDGKAVGFVSTALLDGSAQVILQMLAPLSSMGAITVPYVDVISNNEKVWRSEFGVNVEQRLARNLIKLAKLTKSEQGKWFK